MDVVVVSDVEIYGIQDFRDDPYMWMRFNKKSYKFDSLNDVILYVNDVLL